MTLVELVFVLATIALAAASALPRRSPFGVRQLSPFAAGLVVALLAWLALSSGDAVSWRVLPAAVAFFATAIVYTLDRMRRRRAGESEYEEARGMAVARRSVGAAGLLLGLASVVACSVLPVRHVEPPAGPWPVGTVSFVVEDPTRTGIYLDAPGAPRRFAAQVWYPAGPESSGFPLAPWIADEGVADGYADFANLPRWAMRQLGFIRTNSRLGAPAAAEARGLPVVVISHGWTGSRSMHTDLAEELASRGMVAIAIDHSYGSMSVAFPDGTSIPLYKDALPDGDDPDFKAASRRLVDTYAGDIAAVVALVRSGATAPGLEGRLDGSRIALVGHSTGGGAAVAAAMRDGGIRGVVGLDAWVEPLGYDVEDGLACPQLHVGSESWKGGPNALRLERLKAGSGPWTAYRIAGSGHADFAMIRYVTPLGSVVGMSGRLDGFRFAKIVTPLVCDWLAALLTTGPDAAAASLPAAGTAPELSLE